MGHIGRMLRIEPPGKRRLGMSKRRFMDMNEDIQINVIKDEIGMEMDNPVTTTDRSS